MKPQPAKIQTNTCNPMNPTEEDPFDELETAVSMAIGQQFLLGRALIDSNRHEGAGPGPHEKEGIEFLMIEVFKRLRNAADRVMNMTAAVLRAAADSEDALQAALERAAVSVEAKGGAE